MAAGAVHGVQHAIATILSAGRLDEDPPWHGENPERKDRSTYGAGTSTRLAMFPLPDTCVEVAVSPP